MLSAVVAAVGVQTAVLARIVGDRCLIVAANDRGVGDVPPMGFESGMEIDLADSLCGRALAGQGPRWTMDAARDFPGSAIRERLGVTTYAMVPLHRSDGGLVGTVCALDRRRVELDEDARTLLALLAGILLREQEVHATRGRERAVIAQEAAIASFGLRALESTSLDALLEDATQLVATMLHLPLTCVLELAVDETTLELRAGVGWQDVAGVALSVESSQAGYTLHAQSPVVAPDLALERRFTPSQLLRNHGARSGASVRIGGPLRPYGVLAAHATHLRTFTDDDLHFLQAVANVLAGAIERDRRESQVRYQALHDPLTDLPNRAFFLERLAEALADSRRSQDAVAVLFIDLDRFKVVNDSLGHAAGDALLRVVADRLRAIVRRGDTVARLSGDEFVILCSAEHSGHVAERVTAVLAETVDVDGRELAVAASVGIALADPCEPPEEVLRHADVAMYRAKQRGGGRAVIFDAELGALALERLELETDLRRAVASQSLHVTYQPLVDLVDGAVRKAEALLRWDHPERGEVTPDEFIPVAEATGLIVPLGRWVLREACAAAARWREEVGGGVWSPQIAVNLSARQLADPGLVADVAAAIADAGIPAASLCLEITESVLMEDASTALVTLQSLDALGIDLYIDDFGTGYSSLAYLRRFPVDGVKVDRSFVDGLGREAEDSAIVAAIVSLAHTLGLVVVAEGVETALQLSELDALGCDLAQGFLLAVPADASQLNSGVVGAQAG